MRDFVFGHGLATSQRDERSVKHRERGSAHARRLGIGTASRDPRQRLLERGGEVCNLIEAERLRAALDRVNAALQLLQGARRDTETTVREHTSSVLERLLAFVEEHLVKLGQIDHFDNPADERPLRTIDPCRTDPATCDETCWAACTVGPGV